MPPKHCFKARKVATYKGPACINTVKPCEIVFSFEDSLFLQFAKSRKYISEDFSLLLSLPQNYKAHL